MSGRFRTLETVPTETPACRATSFMPTTRVPATARSSRRTPRSAEHRDLVVVTLSRSRVRSVLGAARPRRNAPFPTYAHPTSAGGARRGDSRPGPMPMTAPGGHDEQHLAHALTWPPLPRGRHLGARGGVV